MKKYKSAYPALKRKVKDPYAAAHLKWVRKATDFHHADAKSKLHASIVNAHMGESVESKANSEWIEKQNVKEPVKKQDKKMAEQKDRIGTPTPSAAAIAKKHGVSLKSIHLQLAKGVKVEREHTDSDAEAHEIARDHLDEFPDYYTRLHKMEKEAKKDMNEATYHARVLAHPAVADVDHGGPGDYFVNLKKGWHLGDGSRSFGNESPRHAWKMLKHATQKDYKKWVGEGADYSEMAAYIMHWNRQDREAREAGYKDHAEREMVRKLHSFKDGRKQQSRNPRKSKVQEDVANSVGGGNIAGMPTADTPDTSLAKPLGMMRRRKKFAGKQVFVVDPDTFHKAYLGKRKYEHYEKYLEGCDIAEEIREFGRTNWAEPIILQNEQTGAMVYLKYGSK